MAIAWKSRFILRAAGVVALVSFLPFAASGCSKGKGDVTGKVTHNGRLVVTGTVSLIGSDGLPYHGTIEEDGSYIIFGVPTGPAKLGVYSPNPAEGGMKIQRFGGAAVKEEAKPTKPAKPAVEKSKPKAQPGEKWFSLPEQVSDPDRSGITLDVKRGQNTFDIAL